MSDSEVVVTGKETYSKFACARDICITFNNVFAILEISLVVCFAFYMVSSTLIPPKISCSFYISGIKCDLEIYL